MKSTSATRAIFGLEIRSLLRDRRTVLMSVVLPIILIPGLLLASTWTEDRRVEREDARIFRVAVSGTEAEFAERLLEAVFAPEGAGEGSTRFRRVAVSDPVRALEVDSIDVHVEALTHAEWKAIEAEARADEGDPEEEAAEEEDPEEEDPAAEDPAAEDRAAEDPAAEDRSAQDPAAEDPAAEAPEREDQAAAESGAGAGAEGAPVLRLRFHSTRTASREGVQAVGQELSEVRRIRRDSILREAGFPVPVEEVAIVEAENVAPEEEVQGARLGRFLTLILLGLMILGGSAVSIDTLAGEKERGTLVTLLTSAASRTEIVTGKLLAVMAVALAIALVQMLNLWIFLGLGIIDPGVGFAVAVSPALAAGLFILYLPVVALTAGVLLLASAYANSYKEAQLYLTPVLAGLLLPTLAPLLPGISLPSAIIVVPVANLSVAARDLLTGQVHVPALVASWLVTAGVAAWVTRRSVLALHDEDLITGDTSRAEFLGGPELFRKRVLRWFLVFWAVKLLVDLNLPLDDVRVAVVVSVGFLFLAFPLLVIRHFRLDPAEALALRKPRPGVWLGVLIGVPAGLVAAQSIFHLMDLLVPVPTELLESFGQAVLPEGVPAWQLILLLSVIPGVAEELTFRGVLLHGLRRRFGPVGLVLAVGLIFGFFHFTIFRIPQTAALGMVLTAVTLLSGSIFPAIVWHTLNNALAVYLGTRGVEIGMEEWWWWAAGSLLLLVVAFRIIWLNRTPYPEVGPAFGQRTGDGARAGHAEVEAPAEAGSR